MVLGGLGTALREVLLLLVQLVDDLVLVGDLVIEALDGVVPVGLLLLKLCDGHLDVTNVFLDENSFLLQVLLVIGGLDPGLLGVSQLLLSLDQSDFEVGLIAVALGLPLMVLGHVALLLLDLGQQSLLLLNNHLVLSKQPHLGVALVLVDAVGCVGL